MTQRKSIVRGRSVDGTVYAVATPDGKGCTWTTKKREATRFTQDVAETLVRGVEFINMHYRTGKAVTGLIVIKDHELAMQGRQYGKGVQHKKLGER